MYVKYGPAAGILSVISLLSCLPVDPPLPQLLEKPDLYFDGFVVVPDQIDGYREAVHLSWTDNGNRSGLIHSYTLLRKLPEDSGYDVFSGSRDIPPDTAFFFDLLDDYAYPDESYDSIYYCMFATDTTGRAGDTSDPCLLFIAPQAELKLFEDSTGCLKWESWIRGGIASRCSVWNEENGAHWCSPRMEEFPFTDEPALFTACFPDSLNPQDAARWWYALYIRANTSQSLVTGVIDVP